MMPAPKRGEIVRQICRMTRKLKEPLAAIISYEMGKSLQEGLGEVQEMIDICDYAVGQSRMLSGITMQSERSLHRMYEQYQPLGIVGIATAFNFPVAVWAWNAMIAAICGDVTIWKPSSTVPLSTQLSAVQEYFVSQECTIEEMEEYEPVVDQGIVIYAGVDYGEILHQAEQETDILAAIRF